MFKKIIKSIKAREIIDSRGMPTVETTVVLADGARGRAGVPGGTSSGESEALELRDSDETRFKGKGVLKAVANVNDKIAPELVGHDAGRQTEIDNLMIKLDGTPNKSVLGANAILSVSVASAIASARAEKLPLYSYLQGIFSTETSKKIPDPMFNIFNGGKHADTNCDFQEFMVVPKGIDGAQEKMRAGAEIFHTLGQVLKEKSFDTDVGKEGGYAPNIDSSVDAVKFIMEAIEISGYKPGVDIFISLDVAASSFYDHARQEYVFKLDDSFLHTDGLLSLYHDWVRDYPILSIEDGLDENDWDGWTQLTRELGDKVLITGDDLFVTQTEKLKLGIKHKAGNAVIVKPNQVGTLTETFEFMKLARKSGYTLNASHRSGETNDTYIADIAVAGGCELLKSGAPNRGERVAKYNRLMEIAEELQGNFK